MDRRSLPRGSPRARFPERAPPDPETPLPPPGRRRRGQVRDDVRVRDRRGGPLPAPVGPLGAADRREAVSRPLGARRHRGAPARRGAPPLPGGRPPPHARRYRAELRARRRRAGERSPGAAPPSSRRTPGPGETTRLAPGHDDHPALRAEPRPGTRGETPLGQPPGRHPRRSCDATPRRRSSERLLLRPRRTLGSSPVSANCVARRQSGQPKQSRPAFPSPFGTTSPVPSVAGSVGSSRAVWPRRATRTPVIATAKRGASSSNWHAGPQTSPPCESSTGSPSTERGGGERPSVSSAPTRRSAAPSTSTPSSRTAIAPSGGPRWWPSSGRSSGAPLPGWISSPRGCWCSPGLARTRVTSGVPFHSSSSGSARFDTRRSTMFASGTPSQTSTSAPETCQQRAGSSGTLLVRTLSSVPLPSDSPRSPERRPALLPAPPPRPTPPTGPPLTPLESVGPERCEPQGTRAVGAVGPPAPAQPVRAGLLPGFRCGAAGRPSPPSGSAARRTRRSAGSRTRPVGRSRGRHRSR